MIVTNQPLTAEEALEIVTQERDELRRMLAAARAVRREPRPERKTQPGDFSMSPDSASWVHKDLDDLYAGESELVECHALLWLLCELSDYLGEEP